MNQLASSGLLMRCDGPVAVIKPSKPAGRLISEVLAAPKARGSTAVIDDEFARLVPAALESIFGFLPSSDVC
jgi:hypothetical protein